MRATKRAEFKLSGCGRLERLCDGRLHLNVADGRVQFREDGDESASQIVDLGEIIRDAPLERSLSAAVYSLLDAVQSSMMELLHGPWPAREGRAALTTEVEMGSDSTIVAGFCDSVGWIWSASLSVAGAWRD